MSAEDRAGEWIAWDALNRARERANSSDLLVSTIPGTTSSGEETLGITELRELIEEAAAICLLTADALGTGRQWGKGGRIRKIVGLIGQAVHKGHEAATQIAEFAPQPWLETDVTRLVALRCGRGLSAQYGTQLAALVLHAELTSIGGILGEDAWTGAGISQWGAAWLASMRRLDRRIDEEAAGLTHETVEIARAHHAEQTAFAAAEPLAALVAMMRSGCVDDDAFGRAEKQAQARSMEMERLAEGIASDSVLPGAKAVEAVATGFACVATALEFVEEGALDYAHLAEFYLNVSSMTLQSANAHLALAMAAAVTDDRAGTAARGRRGALLALAETNALLLAVMRDIEAVEDAAIEAGAEDFGDKWSGRSEVVAFTSR